jgi:hypothetical protein
MISVRIKKHKDLYKHIRLQQIEILTKLKFIFTKNYLYSPNNPIKTKTCGLIWIQLQVNPNIVNKPKTY